MILCHEHRFIFFKTNKTAGNSIEIALSKYCGPDDIITPFSPEAEEMRANRGYRGAQNYLAPLTDYGPRDVVRLLRRGERKKRFFNHIRAREARPFIDADVWNDYYKFCVVRNPWERCISMYYWVHRAEPRPTLDEFLASEKAWALMGRGYQLYTIDGEVAMDRLCRYENLADELEAARLDIGLPEPLDLGSANMKHRRDRRSYRDILTDAQRDRIAEMFREEIELLGYEF